MDGSGGREIKKGGAGGERIDGHRSMAKMPQG